MRDGGFEAGEWHAAVTARDVAQGGVDSAFQSARCALSVFVMQVNKHERQRFFQVSITEHVLILNPFSPLCQKGKTAASTHLASFADKVGQGHQDG